MIKNNNKLVGGRGGVGNHFTPRGIGHPPKMEKISNQDLSDEHVSTNALQPSLQAFSPRGIIRAPTFTLQQNSEAFVHGLPRTYHLLEITTGPDVTFDHISMGFYRTK